ncbi:MAG: binary toxin-like calcium binding domain-containing protein, partial [Psychrilyobacter sp.]|uniref:binary toxin-like calcium binding domain-containing protein n=1 Tax=Psychrilyobacter sp. TaxID=2586924 RepID=UPI003C75DF47
EKWDPNKHSEAKGFIKYKTSPLAFSTDGDPYGDFAEVSGVKMDSRVKKEGRHPLVAAYPRLKVYIDNFDVVSKQTLTTKTGKSISNTISNSTQQTDSHSFEHSYSESLGFKIGHTFSATPSTNIEFSMNFTTGQSVSDTDTTAVTDSTSEQKTLQWETAITTDTTKAAELKLNLHYENLGTAPISNIIPTITISQMGNALSTIKMPTSAQAKTIAAGGRYPHSGNIYVQYENDGRTPIALNINQLNSIMSRNSFEIRTDQVNGEIMKEGTNGQYTVFGSWETYMSRINSVTADISLQLPNKKVKRSKVAAHNSDNNSPEITLKDALVLAFDARIENNQIYIGEERVESGWMISMSGETQKEIKQQLNAMTTPELFAVKLRPNMNILIQKPDPNKSPVIEGAFVSDNGETISVSTLPSLYAIKSVNANVKINGTITNLELTQSPVKARLWTAPINGALNVDYNSKVSVVDSQGRISKASLQIPYGYTPKKPKGLTYVPARKSFDSDAKNHSNLNWQINSAFLPGVKALVLRNTLKGVVGPNVEMRIGDHIIKGGMSGSIQKYSGEELYGYIGAHEPMSPRLLADWGARENIQYHGSVFRMNNFPFNHSISAFNEEYNDKVDVIKFYDATTFKEFDPKSSGLVLYDAVDYKGRSEGFNLNTRWFLQWCREHDNFGPSSYKFVYYYAPRHAPIHDFDMILTKAEVDRHEYLDKPIDNSVIMAQILALKAVGGNDLAVMMLLASLNAKIEQKPKLKHSIFDIRNIFDTEAKKININPNDDEQILNNFELSSEGYFSDKVGSELKIIKPSIKHTIKDLNNSYDIRTQKTNAKAYLIKVTSEKISSDNLKVKFNNEVSINLGVADTQGFGTVTGATTYSPFHSETFILNANPNDPGKISATVSLGEHNRIKTGSDVKIEILGVFSEDGDAYYKIFDAPYKLQNVGTDSTTTSAITLDSSKFVAKPKGYMLRVTANGASSDLLRLKIDEATIDLGTSATKNVNGRVASGVDHSGLMFVPADNT